MSLGGMFVIRCKYVEPKSVTCQIQAQLQAFSSLDLPPTSLVLWSTDTHLSIQFFSRAITTPIPPPPPYSIYNGAKLSL